VRSRARATGRRKRVTEDKGFVGPLDSAHTINSANPLSRKARTGRIPKEQNRQGYPEEHQIEHTGGSAETQPEVRQVRCAVTSQVVDRLGI